MVDSWLRTRQQFMPYANSNLGSFKMRQAKLKITKLKSIKSKYLENLTLMKMLSGHLLDKN